MELETTHLQDKTGAVIYVASLLYSAQGRYYIVMTDPVLIYVIVDIYSKTVEKLTPEIAATLRVIPDETEVIYAV